MRERERLMGVGGRGGEEERGLVGDLWGGVVGVGVREIP